MVPMAGQLDDERVGVVDKALGADGTGAVGVGAQPRRRHAFQTVEVELVDARHAVGGVVDIGLELAHQRAEEVPVRGRRRVSRLRRELVLYELE